jgi:hypothetical protein
LHQIVEGLAGISRRGKNQPTIAHLPHVECLFPTGVVVLFKPCKSTSDVAKVSGELCLLHVTEHVHGTSPKIQISVLFEFIYYVSDYTQN